jgi:hypothetical protein
MNLNLTDDEAAGRLRELDALIDGDRYFMSPRIKTLRAIRVRIRPEPLREPVPPPPKQYAPPRATAKQRRANRTGRRKSQPGLPMTLGGAAAASVRLIVWCKTCQHQVEPDPAE